MVIMLLGHIGAGKSTFAGFLAEHFNCKVVRTSEALRMAAGPQSSRIRLQSLGDELDKSTAGRWILDYIPARDPYVIVDAVRHGLQITAIREAWPDSILVGVRCQEKAMESHIESRKLSLIEAQELITAVRHPLERGIDQLMKTADLVIDNTRIQSAALISSLISPKRRTKP